MNRVSKIILALLVAICAIPALAQENKVLPDRWAGMVIDVSTADDATSTVAPSARAVQAPRPDARRAIRHASVATATAHTTRVIAVSAPVRSEPRSRIAATSVAESNLLCATSMPSASPSARPTSAPS